MAWCGLPRHLTLYSEPQNHRAILDVRLVSGAVKPTPELLLVKSRNLTGFGYGLVLSGQGSPFPQTSAGNQ